jgi:hypothetical protein
MSVEIAWHLVDARAESVGVHGSVACSITTSERREVFGQPAVTARLRFGTIRAAVEDRVGQLLSCSTRPEADSALFVVKIMARMRSTLERLLLFGGRLQTIRPEQRLIRLLTAGAAWILILALIFVLVSAAIFPDVARDVIEAIWPWPR